MKKPSIKISLIFSAFMLSGVCFAADSAKNADSGKVYIEGPKEKGAPELYYPEKDEPFLKRREEGWFFYEDPLADKKEKEKKVEVPPPKPPKEKAEVKPAEPEGPAPLSSEWLKENLPKFLNRAIDNPTQENVAAYMYLQRLSLDKASTFTNAAQEVAMQDPFLSNKDVGPMMAVDREKRNVKILGQIEKIENWVKRDMKVVFFFKSTCEYCIQMSPSIVKLSEEGFQVVPVSINGQPIPLIPQFVKDTGQAKKMGIEITPTLMLYSPEAEKNGYSGKTAWGEPLPPGWAIWSTGYAPLTDLKKVLPDALKLSGFLSKEQYEKTKLYNENYVPMSDPESKKEELREVVQDSGKLVEYMRGQLTKNLDEIEKRRQD